MALPLGAVGRFAVCVIVVFPDHTHLLFEAVFSCGILFPHAFPVQVLSCQPRVTVTSCFVYKIIGDLEFIDHLCINHIRRIGLIHKLSIDSH